MHATLAHFTSPRLIIPELRGEDAASAIQELSLLLHQEKCVPDMLPFFHAALNHEFLVSSEMDAGMAMPHARLPGLREPVFAVGRSSTPIRWSAGAGRAVSLVFLIATPATDSTRYLLLISSVARLSKSDALMKKLHAAGDAKQMLAVLQQVDLTAVRPDSRQNQAT